MGAEMHARRAIVIAIDLLARTRLEGVARVAGLEADVRRLDDPPADPPAIVLADLRSPDDVAAIGAWTERWANVPTVAAVQHVDAATIAAARGAGLTVVTWGEIAMGSSEALRRALDDARP